MKNTQFIINLEDEDYYVKKGDTSWKSTMNLENATRFDSSTDAQDEIKRVSIRSIWPQAWVMGVEDYE